MCNIPVIAGKYYFAADVYCLWIRKFCHSNRKISSGHKTDCGLNNTVKYAFHIINEGSLQVAIREYITNHELG